MADLKEIGNRQKQPATSLPGLIRIPRIRHCLQRLNVWKRTQQTFLQKMQRIWKPDAAAACRKGCLTGSP